MPCDDSLLIPCWTCRPLHELEAAILINYCAVISLGCDPTDLLSTSQCWQCRSQAERETAIVRLLCEVDGTANCNPQVWVDPYWVGRSEQERMSALVTLFCQFAGGTVCDPSNLSTPVAACWLCRSSEDIWSAIVVLLCDEAGNDACDPAVLIDPCWVCRSSAERQSAMITLLCDLLGIGTTPPPPSTLLTGLTSYWKLEEASGVRADSLGTNPLTAVNNPLGVAGQIGNAAQFVAASVQRLTAASNAGLQVGNNDRTCAFWVKLTDKAAIYRMVGKNDGTGLGTEWTVLYRNSTDRFEAIWTQAAPIVVVSLVSPTVPTAGVWYHIVTSHDSVADQIFITVNTSGLASASLVGGCQSLPAISFDIGAESDGGLPLNGVIDEVGWWSRVLTTLEIQTLYNGGAGTTYPFTGLP